MSTRRTGVPGFRWPAVMLSVVAALFMGCEDPLSPEARRRMMLHISDPTLEWDDDYGEFGGVPLAILYTFPHSEIVVQIDDEWVRFGATAVEHAHRPDTGHYGWRSRNHRILFAWRLDDPAERFALGGVAYPGPMGPLFDRPDSVPYAYFPHVAMRTGDRRAWLHRRGRAAFATLGPSPGQCPQPLWIGTGYRTIHTDGTVDTSSTGNFTCEVMSYDVSFEAELGDRAGKLGGTLRLRMMAQPVAGIRMTRDCDGSHGAVAHLCGEWWLAPDQCMPLNPEPAFCPPSSPPVRVDTNGTVATAFRRPISNVVKR